MKNQLKKLACAGFTIALTLGMKAQPGTGSNCVFATNIQLSTNSSTCLSGSSAANSPYSWFRYTALRSVTNFEVTSDPLQTASIGNAHVYSGTCHSLVELGATIDQHSPDTLRIFLSTLSAGQTYYIRLDKSGLGAASFTICSSPAEQVPYQIIGQDVQFDGKVGIGKTPTQALDVLGNAEISGSVTAASATFSNLGSGLIKANNSALGTIPFATTAQYLRGDGNWINFPPSFWTRKDSVTITDTGNVSIIGNLNVSNTLNAGGFGIIQGDPRKGLGSLLQMNGSSSFTGPVNFNNGISFDNSPAPIISYTPGTIGRDGSNGSTLALGANTNIAGALTAPSVSSSTLSINTTNTIGWQARASIYAEQTAPGSAARIVLGNDTRVNGGLNISSLASGTGDQEVYVDQNGNLKLGNTGMGGSGVPQTCSPTNPAWRTGGNVLSSAISNIIGTCNNYDFVMEANGTPYMWLKTDGKFGLGINTPNAMLHVNTQNTGNLPGLIVDDQNPSEGVREFIVNSDGSTNINAISSLNKDALTVGFQVSQGGQNPALENYMRVFFDV